MVPPTVFPSYASQIQRVARLERLECIGWRTYRVLGFGHLTAMDTRTMHGPACEPITGA